MSNRENILLLHFPLGDAAPDSVMTELPEVFSFSFPLCENDEGRTILK